jgi:8-oxo-dGTP pyrophosphatase MutT (NUDIX family)
LDIYAKVLVSSKWEVYNVQLKKQVIMYCLWRGKGKNPCPPGFTALEASAAVVMNAEGTHVAMVNVAAKFAPKGPNAVAAQPKLIFPGGYAEPGEDVIAAAIRESWEETGVKVDTSRPIVHLGGFQSNLSRWPGVMDRYTIVGCYATADSKLGIIDQKEVLHVEWVPIGLLQKALESKSYTNPIEGFNPFDAKISVDLPTTDPAGVPKRIEFGYLSVKWFGRMVDKKYPPRPIEVLKYHNARANVAVLMSML